LKWSGGTAVAILGHRHCTINYVKCTHGEGGLGMVAIKGNGSYFISCISHFMFHI